MRQLSGQPALLALTAWLSGALLAQQRLADPQGQPLLTDARRPGKQQDLGKSTRGDGGSDPAYKGLMTVQGCKSHGKKVGDTGVRR